MPNYPMVYQPNYGYSGVGQQMYPQYQQGMAQAPVQQTSQMQQYGPGLIWVDGEVGAKAFQMPSTWPANQPIALWDTNDTCIYLKSTNPMGMPNPLQKAHYTLEGSKAGTMQSGTEPQEKHEMTDYVRKEDMERMKQELMEAISNVNTGAASGRKVPVKGE